MAAAGWVSGGLGDEGCCSGASAAEVGVGGVADCGAAGGGRAIGAAGGTVGVGAVVGGVGIGGGTLDSERGRTADGAALRSPG